MAQPESPPPFPSGKILRDESGKADRFRKILAEAGASGMPAEEIVSRLVRNEEEIESLCSEILERYEEVSLVYRLSESLCNVMGEAAIAKLVLEEITRVLGSDSGEVWLAFKDRFEPVAVIGMGDEPDSRFGPSGPPQIVLEGGTWVREADHRDPAAVAVPLPNPGGDPIGIMALWGRSEGRSYRTGEVKLLTALAALTSSFIRNDRVAAAVRLADAKEREDEIARQIHQGLLPDSEPVFPGLELASLCRAAENIGGDYFGYLDMPDGGLGLAMADVSGHGVGAALYMAATKGAFQAEARRVVSPSDLLRRTNEALTADFSKSDAFATAFFARFLPGARRLDYAVGGHHPPFIVRVDGGIDRLTCSGIALGIKPEALYQEESRVFEPGEVLVVYTDGLIEARDAQKRFYGIDRLEKLVAGCREMSCRSIQEEIIADLEAHCGDLTPADDVTLVIAKRLDMRNRDAEEGYA